MEVAITSIGTIVPEYKRNQQEAAELIAGAVNLSSAKRRLLKSVYKAMGIEYRYSVLKDYNKKTGEFEFFLLINQNDHHKTIFSCAFGPGLTIESIFLKTHHV